MIVKGIKKSLCIFSAVCLLMMNYNMSFSINSQITPTTEPPTVVNAVYSSPIPTITPTPAKSEPDDYGDDISSAFTISTDIHTTGKINSSDPADIFCFSTDIDVDAAVTIKYSDCVTASILDISENEIDCDERHGNGSLTLGVHALKKNRYFIKIKSTHQKPVDYTVSVACKIDDVGNDFANAKEIVIDQLITGNLLNDTDVDCFKFTPSKKGAYKINSNLDSNNYYLNIYDNRGTYVPTADNFIILNDNDTYYFRVSRNYILPYPYSYNFQIEGPIIDDFGDSQETAQDIQLDDEVKGSISHSYDKDIFSFKPSRDGEYYVYNFSAYDVSGNNIIRYDTISVFDSNSNYLSINNDVTNLKKHFYLSKDKTYYISISTSYIPVLYNYSFTLKGPLEDDFGNTKESAHEIQVDKQIVGTAEYINDKDYFIFRPTEDGAYQIENFTILEKCESGVTPKLENVLWVCDANNKNIYPSFQNNSNAYFYFSKGNKYFISINNNNINLYFKYSFGFKGITNDDFGNTKESSQEILLDTKVNAKFNYYNDKDCFSFVPSDDGAYYIESDNNTGFIIIDENNESINTYSHNSNTQFNLKKNIKYYIFASGYNTYSACDYSFLLKGPLVDDFGDLKENAQEIKLNSFIEGEIESYPDRDYFSFTPSAEGYYYIDKFSSYDGDNIGIGNVLKFYDENGQSVQMNLYRSLYSYFLESGKTYYISISNDNYVNKTFCYSYILRGPIIDDHGNTMGSASKIQLDSPVEGYISLNDIDYFSFKPTKDGLYYIENYQIEDYVRNYTRPIDGVIFYDEEGKVLSRYSDYLKAYYMEKDHTYYISVATGYNMPLIFNYYILLKGPIEDDYGNTKAAAREIGLNENVQGSVNYNNDIDYFSFRSTINGMYYMDSSTVGRDSFNVYNEDGEKFTIITNGSNDYFALEEDTIYYIAVTSLYSKSNYSFSIKLSSTDDYGDSMKTAKEIQSGSQIKGFADILCDIDYFCFKPSESGTYYIDNFYAQRSSFGNDYIYISNVLIVVSSSSGNVYPKYDYNGRKRAYINMVEDETYYIYIKNPEYYSSFNYSFALEGPIVDDYGDSQESAMEIQLDKEVKGSINNVPDYDYFVLEPSITGIYCLDSFKITSYIYNDSPNPNIEIVDSNGTCVDKTYGDYSSNKAYFSLNKGIKYYIYVNSNNEFSLFNYSFTIRGPIIDDIENTPSLSKTLEIGKITDGKIDYYYDKDFFSFTTNEKGYYSLSLNCTNLIDIALYDEHYNMVAKSAFNVDAAKPYYNLLPNKTYYLSISSHHNTKSELNYSISVNGLIVDDYGNSLYDSSLVKIGNTNVKIEYSDDVDILKFIPSSTGTYYFKLDTNIASKVKFYNTYESPQSYTIVDANTASCNLSAYDICYIAINDNATIPIGNYTLTISNALEQDTLKLTGYVMPDFVDNSPNPLKAGFKVLLQGTQSSAISDENGYFEITNIPKSDKVYDIEITKDNYLKREINNVIVNDNISLSTSFLPIEMWAGDTEESKDNAINIKDIIKIAKAFNSYKGDPSYSAGIDFDNNSAINILDVIIMAKHFNESAESYPKVLF
ncbi:MAG TPA: hypothetical protein VIO64_00465 [Pseudobacteroides sp.]|uniref:hypothetical protein n=1 Tax=Pseudobacteroides sp. TaxID=1968840 RepID=UPI002F941D87